MSLREYFEQNFTSDSLKELLDVAKVRGISTRKGERAEMLAAILQSPMEVKRLWGDMDELSRKAVAAAFHNDGFFDTSAFVAQYGKMPERPVKYGWYGQPIIMDLFFRHPRAWYSYVRDRTQLHAEVMPLLARLVPPPDRFELTGLEETPHAVKLDAGTYELDTIETETAGRHDLLLFLTLFQQGEIRLAVGGPKLTPKGVELLSRGLLDSRSTVGQVHPYDEIRAQGLTVFAVDADLADRYRGLTDLGQAYLATENPDILFDAFVQWSEEGTFDELSRISAIKGVRSKGLKLTPPAERRERIVEALSWCPTGVWISVFEFYRALKVWHLDFDLEVGGLERLYVGHQYRGRGYYEPWADREAMWMLTNGLYVNAVLWEYLATIGALDLATSDDPDFFPAATYYGAEDRPVSGYDGLAYFRITPLGAYLFGQASEYTPTHAVDAALFRVDAQGGITLLNPAALTEAHRIQLEQMAEPTASGYRLSTQKLLTILEDAKDLSLVRAFLEQRNDGPLPAEVIDLLDEVQKDSRACKVNSRMLTINVRSAELVQEILADPVAGKIVRHLEGRTLLIPENRENALRDALREMGYGLRAR